jgi:hypothetical protein
MPKNAKLQVCSDPNSFSLDAAAEADPTKFLSKVDSECSLDYIDIAGKYLHTYYHVYYSIWFNFTAISQ